MSTEALAGAAVDGAPVGWQSGRGRVVGRLVRQPVTMAALTFLVAMAVVAVLAPAIAPYGENEQDLARQLEGPSADHWLGTDNLGRDTLSRLIFGARVALQAAIQASLIACLIGIPLGLFLAYRGGWWDRILMRVVDAGDAFPGIVLALAVIAVLGPSLTNAMVAVGLIFVPGYVRLTRALVLAERERLYVDAAKVAGLRTANILLRQILPNVAAPLIVRTALTMGAAMLIESSLTFLGVGADISRASWGGMLSVATQLQARQPLMPWPPGIAITLTVLAFNLLGDGLRDALGGEQRRPRRRRRAAAAAAPAAADRPATAAAALAIEGLTVRMPLPSGVEATIVEDVSLELRAGETLGLVGESGSGKTITGLAIMGLLPAPGYVAGGSIRLAGRELAGLSDRELEPIRGRRIAMIVQDPIAALSPVHTIGRQLTQALRNHHAHSAAQARDRAVELLALVGVDDPRRLEDYPHQFSGGMAQRVVIAMALAGEPDVLIADEPTTALDVTIQRQILDLLRDLQGHFDMSVLLITHDLGVIAESCERAVVMYAGQVVETARVDDLFAHPRHPYTSALLAAMPRNGTRAGRLATIEGRVPPAWAWPAGCRFHPRCRYATDECRAEPVPLRDGARCVRQSSLVLDAASEPAS